MINSLLLPSRRGRTLIGGIILLYILVFVVFSIGRYERYNATGWDLGIYAQLSWNASQGRLLQNTLAEYNNFLAIHSTYISILFAPLFWVWADPRVVLIAQSVCLAVGAWPIARIAGRKFSQWWIPPLFAGLWLLYPALGWINRWDFHPEILAVTFFAFAFEAADRQAWRQTDVWLILAILCKEEMGMNVAFFAIFMAWKLGRNRRVCITWFVIGMAWFFVHAFIIFPILRHAENGLPIHAARYTYLLSGNLQTIWTYLTGPDLLVKLGFLVKLFFPVAFVALLYPESLLMTIPTFALSLLSAYKGQFSIHMHYTIAIIPAILVSAIYGASRLSRERFWKLKQIPVQRIVMVMLCTTVIGWLLDNPLYSVPDDVPIYGWDAGAHVDALKEVEGIIPPDKCVVAENNIEPHYSIRPETYVMGVRGDMDGCTYMIVDLGDRRYDDFGNNEAIACYQFWSQKRVPIYFRDTVVVLVQSPADAKQDAWQKMQDYCTAFAQTSH